MSGKSHIRALLTLINSAAEAAIVEYDKSGHGIPSLASTEPHPLDTSDDTSNLKKALRLLEVTSLYPVLAHLIFCTREHAISSASRWRLRTTL